ncbi:hypothetical protein WICPIJ_007103 [Wickerhamomyces pijperi]|uniref:Mitochondrial aspartate-glutamate transporter AGC1 n=1 Tax=Wickerhamomyces pijperi TaxID=599730 RepID=A0A9P8Q0U0_WICPI|nr:hypothetical protein WICPIJ_007103 [Wickerhamomyces pijperi]
MELPNSNNQSKKQQTEIFKSFAKYNEDKTQLRLDYQSFIELISSSTHLYSNFTDHNYNYNQINNNIFGLLFFIIDENNKGFLTINDWFHFNNLLSNRNYQYIFLYEFFKKFDSGLKDVKSINYNAKSLSFDNLYLNLADFKQTLSNLQQYNNNEFFKINNLNLNWTDITLLNFYLKENKLINLNSILTFIQNDLLNYKIYHLFKNLSIYNPMSANYVISKNQLKFILHLNYDHKISNQIFNSLNFTNITLLNSTNNSISFANLKDFIYIFNNLDLLNQILLKYNQIYHNLYNTDKLLQKDLPITKPDFINFLNYEYKKINNIVQFSPSQINLLFSIVENYKYNLTMHQAENPDLPHDNLLQFLNQYNKEVSSRNSLNLNEYSLEPNQKVPLHISDFLKITNPNYLNDLVYESEISERINSNFYFFPIFDSIYNFTLGSIAGAIGATIVYPIDLIKTRMQAQRTLIYKNSLDCFVKIFQKEGIKGLYSGIGLQLIGVAPEKAIKLTMNDFAKGLLTTKYDQITLGNEILAGASAGFAQVIFTNPLEIVKIRLQIQGNLTNEAERATGVSIINKLGLKGLYKGVTACLLRDVPFSAIYFPTYNHIKKDLFHYDPKDKNSRSTLNTWELLVSGGLAGMPAAFLTTPFDVIKTRLQMVPKKGETKYNGIIHAFKTILREEKFSSFFKGGGARVLRSSPQFGFTLAAYEIFQSLFPLNDISFLSKTSGDNSPTLNISNSIKQDIEKRYYLNYYYKSCQISKIFIDLDYNFKEFNYDIYTKFYQQLKQSKALAASDEAKDK